MATLDDIKKVTNGTIWTKYPYVAFCSDRAKSHKHKWKHKKPDSIAFLNTNPITGQQFVVVKCYRDGCNEKAMALDIADRIGLLRQPKPCCKPRRRRPRALRRTYQYTSGITASGEIIFPLPHDDPAEGRKISKARYRAKEDRSKEYYRRRMKRLDADALRERLNDALERLKDARLRGTLLSKSSQGDYNYNSNNTVLGYNPIANDGKALNTHHPGISTSKIPKEHHPPGYIRYPWAGRYWEDVLD